VRVTILGCGTSGGVPRLGGKDGAPHRYRLLSEGREPRVLRTKEVGIELHPGDCLEIRSSGGGGWGPPAKRTAIPISAYISGSNAKPRESMLSCVASTSTRPATSSR